jgi:hypothetical protein
MSVFSISSEWMLVGGGDHASTPLPKFFCETEENIPNTNNKN